MMAALRPVIVTGDDFGLNDAVNQAIAETHRRGLLGSASLMVTGQAVDQAVTMAKDMPALNVGLHLAVTRAQALLPPRDLPTITDKQGRLGRHLARTGVVYFFSPAARRELRAEIRAQFESFAATGLALDHVDGHNHMHLHPTVLSLLLDVGADFGLKAVRLPYEPFGPAWRMFGGSPWRLGASWLFLKPWTAAMKGRLRSRSLYCNDYLFGMSHTGQITVDALAGILDNLPKQGLTEVHLHPGLVGGTQDEEHIALTDAGIRELFHDLGLYLTSFAAQFHEAGGRAS